MEPTRPETEARRYWRIVAGERGVHWHEFASRSVIALGWPEPIDMRDPSLTIRDDMRQHPAFAIHDGKFHMHSAAKVWSIGREMSLGDIALGYGQGQVLGWGVVAGEYEYVEDDFGYAHRRPVEWLCTTPLSCRDLPKPLADKLGIPPTLVELTVAECARVMEAMPPPERRVWIFQGRPDMYDVDGMLQRGGADDWRMSRHHRRSQIGDVVLFWKAGADAGIYGRGLIISKPYERSEGDTAVDVSVSGPLSAPVLAAALGEHDVLSQMLIMRQRQGVDFPVTPEEWEALEPLLGPVAQPTSAHTDALPLISSHLAARGFTFTDRQIACFCTALQAKGFVILSGISGTGKTKLVQHFSQLLPQPAGALRLPEDAIWLTVKPYMHNHGQIVIPNRMHHLLPLPEKGQSVELSLRFGEQQERCLLANRDYAATAYVELLPRVGVRRWLGANVQDGDPLVLEPEVDDYGALSAIRFRTAQEVAVPSDDGEAGNMLFVPVRPDWRDSKALLGYYNPLDNTYHWTDFLRFVLRAAESHAKADGLAWFVLLDEMNLAHVEYYFADLLSVLESGRDPETGLTKEALRIDCPEDAEGQVPPRDVRLPPNLYVAGTVNQDETTYAFSPKVLDRAFTIEFTEVDFADYPPAFDPGPEAVAPTVQASLLSWFTDGGRFAQIDKGAVAAAAAAHPEFGRWLQTLNGLLQAHDMHFGYRVFDEVHVFLDWADRNGLFGGDAVGAFDAAVLMKVLPKFHGSRGKLEAPLVSVLAWCQRPQAPDVGAVRQVLEGIEGADGAIIGALDVEGAVLPATARKAARMLRTLYVDGFAAFA